MRKNPSSNLTDVTANEPIESLVTSSPPLARSNKHHLLIITDSEESRIRLRAALMADDIEITAAASPEEMCRGCCGQQDLVVIDVGPEHLGEILKTLRNCAGCAEVPVLVEISRISAAPALAGLLPTYRAMPCGYADLIALARRRLAARPAEHQSLGIL
jgi:DNA-binding NtrC family response regulator